MLVLVLTLIIFVSGVLKGIAIQNTNTYKIRIHIAVDLPFFSFALSSFLVPSFQQKQPLPSGLTFEPGFSVSSFRDRHTLSSFQLLQAITNKTTRAVKANDPSTPPIIAAVSTGVPGSCVVVTGVVVVMAAVQTMVDDK